MQNLFLHKRDLVSVPAALPLHSRHPG